MRKLNSIEHGPITGGNADEYTISSDNENEVRNAKKRHYFVDGRKRSDVAVKIEIVLSAINFHAK